MLLLRQRCICPRAEVKANLAELQKKMAQALAVSSTATTLGDYFFIAHSFETMRRILVKMQSTSKKPGFFIDFL